MSLNLSAESSMDEKGVCTVSVPATINAIDSIQVVGDVANSSVVVHDIRLENDQIESEMVGHCSVEAPVVQAMLGNDNALVFG